MDDLKDPVKVAAGRKGAAALKERHGREHFVRLGQAGGAANARKHSPQHFAELGRRGGQQRWDRARAAKAAAEGETP